MPGSPVGHLVEIDAIYIQSHPWGVAVLRWCKVNPAIQPPTIIGMANKKATKLLELHACDASILSTSYSHTSSAQSGESLYESL